jgi:tRNA pseudouridine38-40 synthase
LPNFKFTLAYDGTGLVGWQRQASGISVQGLLEDALGALDSRPVAIAAAGRTDAGVHALGQVASASLERDIDGTSLARALNARLPAAVRVLEAIETPATFHPRFDARSKTYRYRIWNGEVMSPFERAYAWHVAVPSLDVEAMAAAAALVRGRHDFAAFQAAGTGAATTERVMFASAFLADPARVSVARPALITYEISGSGFLRYMVRNIVGTLVEVGRGKRPPQWVSEVLASRDRGEAGQTAPAEGLFLVRVEYDQPRAGPRGELAAER